MASNMMEIDRNEAANLYYNISLWFNDTGTVGLVWRQIKEIRKYQSYIPEDTTAFTILPFPPDPLPLAGVIADREQMLQPVISVSPNPGKDHLVAQFITEKPDVVTLALYNLRGEEVQSVHSGFLQQGEHSFHIPLQSLADGTYYLRLVTPTGISTTKVVVLN